MVLSFCFSSELNNELLFFLQNFVVTSNSEGTSRELQLIKFYSPAPGYPWQDFSDKVGVKIDIEPSSSYINAITDHKYFRIVHFCSYNLF